MVVLASTTFQMVTLRTTVRAHRCARLFSPARAKMGPHATTEPTSALCAFRTAMAVPHATLALPHPAPSGKGGKGGKGNGKGGKGGKGKGNKGGKGGKGGKWIN